MLEIRIFETKLHPRIIVCDGKEVLIRLDRENKRERFHFDCIWSADPSLVKVMDTYMKSLWKMAKKADFSKFKRDEDEKL